MYLIRLTSNDRARQTLRTASCGPYMSAYITYVPLR